ncbi:MAG: sigma-70 family RNA polymerase sigma factor [Clostridiales bacterium]|nr:sigma-70 family RNA polymerase sigma factor [Clostridiales bacterium]
MTTAEDITQEVFMKVIEHHMTFESYEHEKAWLIRVTINLCKSYFKTAWFRKTTELTEDVATEDYISLTVEQQDLLQQLNYLKVEDRNIIYLYYYEEYSIYEIGEILGMNKNTVSTRLRRAKSKLKGLMEGDELNGTEV